MLRNCFRKVFLSASVLVLLLTSSGPAALAGDDEMSLQHHYELEAIARASNISVEEATARDQFRQRAQPLYDAVTADPDNFAGIYSTDDGGPWRIVVRFVGDAPLASAMALVGDGVPVEWVEARYSMAQLNRVFGDLLRQLEPDIQAQRVSQVTPDEASNTVLVGLPNDNPDLQKALTQQFGDIVSFRLVPVFEPIP